MVIIVPLTRRGVFHLSPLVTLLAFSSSFSQFTRPTKCHLKLYPPLHSCFCTLAFLSFREAMFGKVILSMAVGAYFTKSGTFARLMLWSAALPDKCYLLRPLCSPCLWATFPALKWHSAGRCSFTRGRCGTGTRHLTEGFQMLPGHLLAWHIFIAISSIRSD